MTANFAIVFSGPAIRRARRELVNIQGGTIALLEDCNSSPPPSFPLPSLSSMKRCVKKRFESVAKRWDKGNFIDSSMKVSKFKRGIIRTYRLFIRFMRNLEGGKREMCKRVQKRRESKR